MNSYRRGLRNGVIVNQKLFILEKFNLAPHTNGWSNLVKRVKNLYYLVWVITPCVNMHGSFEGYKMGAPIQFVSKKKREEGKREREEKKREREEIREKERRKKKKKWRKKRKGREGKERGKGRSVAQ